MLIIYIVFKLRKATAKPSDNRSAIDTATSVPVNLPDKELQMTMMMYIIVPFQKILNRKRICKGILIINFQHWSQT